MALFTTIHVPFDNGYNVSTSSSVYTSLLESTNDFFTDFDNSNIVGRNDFSRTSTFAETSGGFYNNRRQTTFSSLTTFGTAETRGATSTTTDSFFSSSSFSEIRETINNGTFTTTTMPGTILLTTTLTNGTTSTGLTSKSGATTIQGPRGTTPGFEFADDSPASDNEPKQTVLEETRYNPNTVKEVPVITSFVKTFPFFSTVETTTEKNVLTSTTINAGEITATTTISLVEFSTTTTETGEPISSTLGSMITAGIFVNTRWQAVTTTRGLGDLSGRVLYWAENETIYSKRRMVGKNPGDIVGFEEAFEGVIEPDSYYETTVEGLEEPVKVFSKIFTDPVINTFMVPQAELVTTNAAIPQGNAGSAPTTLTTNGFADSLTEEKTVMDIHLSTTTASHSWTETTESEITRSLLNGTSFGDPPDPATVQVRNVSIVEYSRSTSYTKELNGIRYLVNTTTFPVPFIANTSDGENTTFNFSQTIGGLGTVSTTSTKRVETLNILVDTTTFQFDPVFESGTISIGIDNPYFLTFTGPQRAATRIIGRTIQDFDRGTANSFVRLTRDAVTTSFSPTIMRTHYISALGKSYGPMQAVINSPDMRFSNDWGLGASIPEQATSAVTIAGRSLYANGVFGVTVGPEIISEDGEGNVTFASVTQSIDSVTYSTNTDTDVTGDQTSTFQISAIIPGAETIFGNFRYGGWGTTQIGTRWTIFNSPATVVNPFTQIDGDQTEATIHIMGYYSYTSFDRYGNNTFKSFSLFVDEEDRFKPQELTIKDGDVIAFRIAVGPTAYQAAVGELQLNWNTNNDPIFSAFTIT